MCWAAPPLEPHSSSQGWLSHTKFDQASRTWAGTWPSLAKLVQASKPWPSLAKSSQALLAKPFKGLGTSLFKGNLVLFRAWAQVF